MRARSILLRLLLSLALVVNGLSAVHAGVFMAVDGVAHAAMAAHDAGSRDAEPPCHDAMTAVQDDAARGDEATPSPAAASDDCCPVGCLCNCVSSAPTLVQVHALAPTPLLDSGPVSALRVPHASPALPDLIRPPIG